MLAKFDVDADPDGLAELLTSIALGFVAQRAMAGSASPAAHVAALESLSKGSVTRRGAAIFQD
jgi:hypothetical protein